jgi:poly(3-hydroxybutyrate) depolymerase
MRSLILRLVAMAGIASLPACSAGVSTTSQSTSGSSTGSPGGGGSGSGASGAAVVATSGSGSSSGDVTTPSDAGGASSGNTASSGSSVTDGGSAGSDSAGDGGTTTDAAQTPSGPSAGCGKVPTQATGKYVQSNIMVTSGLAPKYVAMYTARNYYVWLPTGYDPMRKYATVFLGHGCGGNGSQVLPIQNASMGDAILVGLSAVGQCFMTGAADSPDIAFFDAALAAVESSFCVDKAKVFIAGFSSGSWLANLIGCARAGIVRGQGNASGGLPPLPTCSGPIAAILAHDMGDTANSIMGGMAARDRILKINGCSLTDTVPYDIGKPSMCVSYKGCPAAYPVVWCPTTGQGHSDQVSTGISVPGFWNFWKALP